MHGTFRTGHRTKARAAIRAHFAAAIAVGFGAIWTAGTAAAPAAEKPSKSLLALGMNLAGPADWNTELPFVDVFRLSRRWISQQKGQPWGKGPPLDLDEHGWVRRLEPDCWAETLVCTIEGGHYPSGRYTLLYEGQGEITISNAGKVVSRQPGRMVLEVDARRGALFVQVRKTEPKDYVRNIRLIMPGFEGTYEKEPFHPAFLRRWKGMACFRFMDWMETNNSPIRQWKQRPTVHHATFSDKGVPLEWMIDLCNRQQADAWFCMPHLADDDYVRHFARMVKERLDPRRKVYVEYSNEVWNGIFQQHRWAAEEGMRRGLAPKPWEAAWRWTALRSVEIFRLWEEEFGRSQRLVRVLATQAANPYVSEQVLAFQDAYRHADVLAIAPYISFNVPAQGKRITAAVVEGWTLEQLLDHVEQQCLPQAIDWMRRQKAVADKYGLELVAYEGGQHLVGVAGGENNEKVTALFHAANRHPRMGQIYDRYFAAWQQTGGKLFCYFSSVGRWSKWGSWGALEYYDDDPAQAPKFQAILRFARKLGQDVGRLQ